MIFTSEILACQTFRFGHKDPRKPALSVGFRRKDPIHGRETAALLTFYRRHAIFFSIKHCSGHSGAARIGDHIMDRIITLETRNLCESAKNGGCGECQTSCQSACKTSCGVANQKCENADK